MIHQYQYFLYDKNETKYEISILNSCVVCSSDLNRKRTFMKNKLDRTDEQVKNDE